MATTTPVADAELAVEDLPVAPDEAPSTPSPPPAPTTASDAVHALEVAWSAIREHHPDLPLAYFTVGSGREGRRTAINGHWAGSRWQPRDQGAEELAEVFMAGERMEQGGEAVMGTLLHEAAHGINHGKGVKDTSQNGAYHNNKYKSAAEAVMLSVEKAKKGWCETDHTDGSRTRYAAAIAALDAALKHYRVGPAQDEKKDAPKPRIARVKMECDCPEPRTFLMVPTQVLSGITSCGACTQPFTCKTDKLKEWLSEQIEDAEAGGTPYEFPEDELILEAALGMTKQEFLDEYYAQHAAPDGDGIDTV